MQHNRQIIININIILLSFSFLFLLLLFLLDVDAWVCVWRRSCFVWFCFGHKDTLVLAVVLRGWLRAHCSLFHCFELADRFFYHPIFTRNNETVSHIPRESTCDFERKQ